MDEGHKTAIAFLGIFAFLGLAIFFQADIGELDSVLENPVIVNSDSQQSDSEQVEASTRYTDSFESELGPEYVFDIETRNIERLRAENGREYYQASLSFQLTDFGERIAEAESGEEVRSIVESSFEDYPEGDFEQALMNDVALVEQGEPHRLEAEALQGRIENIQSSDQGVDLSVSVEEGLSPQVKWGSFSTVWTMNTGLSSAPDCSSYPSKYSGGGTESSPWTVMNVSGLQCMNQTLDGNYTLGQNIDASYTENWNSGSGFDPVAEDFNVYFEGLLDGNGYAINELHIDRPSEEYVGLFGFTRGSNITNLQLSNVNITGGNYTGALSGTNAAFEVSKAWISRVAVTGEVNGGNQVGGIVGYQIYSPTTISESFVNANVSGGSSVGGLIGSNAQNALVNNSYSTSYVKATGGGNYDAASGLVGLQEGGVTRNSFSSSDVESVTWVGQVLFDPDKEPEDTYWNGDKIYDSDADAYSNRGTNLTEAEMKGNSAQTAMSGLDFTDTWETVEASDSDASDDGYPVLQALDRGNQLDEQDIGLKSDGGTSSDSFEVSSCQGLQDIQNNLSADYELKSDIDCGSYTGFGAIGSDGNRFSGVFNGSGYVISNLTVDGGSESALFGATSESAQVVMVGLEGVNVTGGLYTGGLVGWNNGEVRKSYVKGKVSGSSQLGGLVGFNQNGEVFNSYSEASVTGSDNTRIGGLVGRGGGVYTSYSIGDVTGDPGYDNGGLLGAGSATDSYWDINASGESGSSGGIGLSSKEMTGDRAINNMQGFDFDQVWQDVSCYPRLDWETVEQENLPWSGCGEGNIPYEISSCQELRAINQEGIYDVSYQLVNSLSCGESSFQPIAEGTQFSGVFNGDGNKIADLDIDSGSNSALFSETSSSAVIRAVQLADINVQGGYYTGALVGWNRGIIRKSSSSGYVAGTEQLGGLVGLNNGGEVIKSYSGAEVNGSSDTRIGGLVGRQLDNGEVVDSYSYGNVSGSTGYDSGGLVGDGGQVTDSYWDAEKSGQSTSAGGSSLTTSEMTGSSASANMNNLDFTDTWETVEASDSDASDDGYPVLQALDRGNQLEVQGVDLQDLLGSIVGVSSEGVIQTENGVVQTTP